MDEDLVDSLCAERSELRARREYEKADAIKAQILAMGVTVVDQRDREGWYVTQRSSRVLEDERPAPSERRARREPRDFGPRGHDYERTGEQPQDKALSEEAVDELLAARLLCKLKGNFARADACLSELKTLGVSVCDKTKKWRADGVKFEGELSSAYERIAGDGDADSLDLDPAPILALIAARAAAKGQRDFSEADALAQTLRSKYRVVVDDRRKKWRVVRFYGDYFRIGPKVGKAEPKIGELLARRTERLREHGEADEEATRIVGELAAMGVQLDERSKTWKRPRRSDEEMAALRKHSP